MASRHHPVVRITHWVIFFAALAAVLLTGSLPAWLDTPPRDLKAADGSERPQRVAALCTDFTGCVSGVLVAPGGTDS